MPEPPRTSRRVSSHSACPWWHAQRTERCANSLAGQGEIPPYQLPTHYNRPSSSANTLAGKDNACLNTHVTKPTSTHKTRTRSKRGGQEESWDWKEITMGATGFTGGSDSRRWRQIQIAAALPCERHKMQTSDSYIPAFLYQHYTSLDFFPKWEFSKLPSSAS